MSLLIGKEFHPSRRILNTNIDGRTGIILALTKIKGVGRRYASVLVKKADISNAVRAGQLTEEEVEKLVTVLRYPLQYKIPTWFLNRQRDVKDGKFGQMLSNNLETKLREDLERLKKIRCHRGFRHHWGLRVRGQRSRTTGRIGRTVGVSKKK